MIDLTKFNKCKNLLFLLVVATVFIVVIFFSVALSLDSNPLIKKINIYLAVQCCEHLNRALVVEKQCAKEYSLSLVSVVPYPDAGGPLCSSYYRLLDSPAVVEEIQADAGIDIGDTLIGMHLKKVAVPVKLSIIQIGYANLVAARVRPRFIGGERARYK